MGATVKLHKSTFQHVEAELYRYHETKREITRIKNDILYGTRPPDENIGGGRSNTPGDPTGRAGTLLASHRRLEQMERIVDAIESVYDRLPDEKKKLIELRYWSRPQLLTWDGIALHLHVGRMTAIRWRDEIVKSIAELVGWR